MYTYLEFSALNAAQIKTLQQATSDAYPSFIIDAPTVKKHWNKLGTLFPQFQLSLVNDAGLVLGFMNMIPIFLDRAMVDLPDEGWDWLIQKGMTDFENNIAPNCLGGLQINVLKQYQGKGFSKMLIQKGKEIMLASGFTNFIIPIRPTWKHKHPKTSMDAYLSIESDKKIYDPWIRTHVNNGAKIIKVCKNSMHIDEDINFWESHLNMNIEKSGEIMVPGALNPILVHKEENYAEYREENLWIRYS